MTVGDRHVRGPDSGTRTRGAEGVGPDGIMIHDSRKRLRSRSPSQFPEGSHWLVARNIYSFYSLLTGGPGGVCEPKVRLADPGDRAHGLDREKYKSNYSLYRLLTGIAFVEMRAPTRPPGPSRALLPREMPFCTAGGAVP